MVNPGLLSKLMRSVAVSRLFHVTDRRSLRQVSPCVEIVKAGLHSDASCTITYSGEFICEKDQKSEIVEKLVENNLIGWNFKDSFFLGELSSLPCKKSISGNNLLTFIRQYREECSEIEAEKVAQELLDAKYIVKVDPGKEFRNSSGEGNEFRKKGLYKVTGRDVNDWKSLNTEEIAGCVSQCPEKMAQNTRKIVLKLYSNFLSNDGATVDYQGMAASPLWASFKQMATQLQRVDLDDLSGNEKLAFFINIYNVLIIHGIVEKGEPRSDLERYRFFSETSYVIGGYTLSLNDIENGILRSNRSSMATLNKKPFGKSDPRMKLILPEVETRIHFALNCGAKSCPPIKIFSGKEVQSQLDRFTNAFFENDEALIVDVPGKSVQLTKLIEWYEEDFGKNKKEVLQWVRDHIKEPTKKQQLNEVLNDDEFMVSFLPYDWTNNKKYGVFY